MERLHPDEMAKLPKWAQRHLEVCYNQIDSLARDKAALFQVPPEDAQVVLTHFHGASGRDENDDQPLRKHQRVKFFPLGPKNHRWQNYIEVGLDLNRPGEITIHGCERVVVIPHATNTFNVRLDKDHK